MNIGWIDFSERDRRKAIDIIHLLKEQGAIDELGIGPVRDGFANIFFPGSSTIQTRAKYFFIVPYAIKTCCENPRYQNVAEVRKALDDMERTCAQVMKDRGGNEGVIGSDVLPDKWVVRRPSSIYWNGIKTFGFLTSRFMSIDECIKESIYRRGKENLSNWREDGEENEQDDREAGHEAMRPLWNLPPFSKNWLSTLDVSLSKKEVEALRDAISRQKGSLYKYILDNNLGLSNYISLRDQSFRAICDDIKDKVPDHLGQLMQMAVKMDTLIYLCRVLFNKVLSEDNNGKAKEEWNEWYTERHLSEIRSLSVGDVFLALGLQSRGLKCFLEKMRLYFLEDKIVSAKSCLEEWEIELKGRQRSKLCRRNEFRDVEWVGGRHLDFRFLSASRIISDIYAAEGRSNV